MTTHDDLEKPFSAVSGGPSSSVSTPPGKVTWAKAQALDRMGGDEELLRELCQIFLEESPKLLQKLQQAIADRDSEAMTRVAHSLKGELGYLSAAAATQAAGELEDMGHENNLSRAVEALVVLERELAAIHLALKDTAGVIR
jgi:two-component system, sensor histidine kinase and response regulator